MRAALALAASLGVADALGDEERTVKHLAAACGAEPTALHPLATVPARAQLGIPAAVFLRLGVVPFYRYFWESVQRILHRDQCMWLLMWASTYGLPLPIR